jgi:hypothetical protein
MDCELRLQTNGALKALDVWYSARCERVGIDAISRALRQCINGTRLDPGHFRMPKEAELFLPINYGRRAKRHFSRAHYFLGEFVRFFGEIEDQRAEITRPLLETNGQMTELIARVAGSMQSVNGETAVEPSLRAQFRTFGEYAAFDANGLRAAFYLMETLDEYDARAVADTMIAYARGYIKSARDVSQLLVSDVWEELAFSA